MATRPEFIFYAVNIQVNNIESNKSLTNINEQKDGEIKRTHPMTFFIQSNNRTKDFNYIVYRIIIIGICIQS